MALSIALPWFCHGHPMTASSKYETVSACSQCWNANAKFKPKASAQHGPLSFLPALSRLAFPNTDDSGIIYLICF